MDSRQLSKLIKKYYDIPGNISGGNCHVVLDDNNVDDLSVEYCLKICKLNNDDLGILIMENMKNMKKTARGKSIYYALKEEK